MRRPVLGLLALPLVLSSCTFSPASRSGAPTEEAVAPSPAVEPAAGHVSGRGNVITEVGEVTTLTVKNKRAATFVVESIQVDPTCTNPHSSSPENGHLLAVRLSAETTPDLADSPGSNLSLYFLWTAIADNGATFSGNLISAAAVACMTEAERFPVSLGPGQRSTGIVVLDVPTPTGVLVNQQPHQKSGWEWQYTDAGH